MPDVFKPPIADSCKWRERTSVWQANGHDLTTLPATTWWETPRFADQLDVGSRDGGISLSH
jgi:hypothetical protein